MRFILTAAVLLLSLPLSAQTENVETVNIPSGDAVMFGSMFTADGPGPHPTVLLLHGYPGSVVYGGGADWNVLELAQPLQAAGFNVLAFNYRGAWGSSGSYGVINQIDDVKAALAFVREEAARFGVDPTRVTVVGASFGGWNALITTVEETSVTCTVAIAPAEMRAAIRGLRERNALTAPDVDDPVPGLGGLTWGDNRRELLANERRVDVAAQMEQLRDRPLLIIQAKQDEVVPPEWVATYVDAARTAGASPFVHVEIDADHNFSLDGNRAELANVVVSWLTEHCM